MWREHFDDGVSSWSTVPARFISLSFSRLCERTHRVVWNVRYHNDLVLLATGMSYAVLFSHLCYMYGVDENKVVT